jgi:regulator of sigma E protease
MEILIQAGQLILSLSILIVLHELGHFLPARWFGIKVEKFYLFFDPWFSLFKVKKGDTEYGIGWLPLGGYVKISGMIDESMDKEQLNQPPQPWEFRSKPAWQRLIVMIGGVTVNIILGFLIYIMILWVWGKDFIPTENAKYGIYVNEQTAMGEDGLQHGDKIISVGGQKPKTLEEANSIILIDGIREIEIDRNGKLLTVSLPEDIEQTILNKGDRMIFEIRVPFVIDSVLEGKNAEEAGLKKGDSLVGVEGMPNIGVYENESEKRDSLIVMSPYFQDIVKVLKRCKDSKVTFLVMRNDELKRIKVEVDENGQVGVGNKDIKKLFEVKHESYGFFASIPAGISSGWGTLTSYVKSLGLLFTPAGAKNIGGFGSIGGLFSKEWDWLRFWSMTAFISIILAFMNILPIPALDGGHVMFLLYEMITGRAPGQRFMEIAQLIGMVFLLGLLLYANGNDIFKAIF